jgi:hypothetical protein
MLKNKTMSSHLLATGQGFDNTSKLRVMTYKEVIQEHGAAEWQKESDKEHARMMQHKAWIAVPRSEVPKWIKILGSTWAMKRKANGTRRARLNTKGCSQRPGLHYDKDNISSPVTNLTSIRRAFILMVMADFICWVKDVNGALHMGRLSSYLSSIIHVHTRRNGEMVCTLKGQTCIETISAYIRYQTSSKMSF